MWVYGVCVWVSGIRERERVSVCVDREEDVIRGRQWSENEKKGNSLLLLFRRTDALFFSFFFKFVSFFCS